MYTFIFHLEPKTPHILTLSNINRPSATMQYKFNHLEQELNQEEGPKTVIFDGDYMRRIKRPDEELENISVSSLESSSSGSSCSDSSSSSDSSSEENSPVKRKGKNHK